MSFLFQALQADGSWYTLSSHGTRRAAFTALYEHTGNRVSRRYRVITVVKI